MAGSLLDIYGSYTRAADRYNNAGNAWNQAVADYNASIISDRGRYDPQTGNYAGGGPYTYYDGYTVGRTGDPLRTYQTDPTGYNTVTDYNNIVGYQDAYDPESGASQQPIYATSQVPYYGGTNETTYVDPTTGLASMFAARPSASFDMGMPTAPQAAPTSTVMGNIDPTTLYQTLYGKGTPDIMSNEAWALQNVSTPFLSPETSAYETGGVNRMNNPLYYAGPDSLTTGQIGQDVNSYISGQQTGNVYY